MAEFQGDEVVLEFGGTDISVSARTVTVSEDPGEPEKLDVTVKADTARQYLEGFPGGDNTTVTMNALANAAADTIEPIATNTTGNVEILPEGDVQGGVKITINSMRLINKEYTTPYDGAVEWNLTWNSTTAATYGTNAT